MIAAVIIASGFSRRMGRSKLMLLLGDRTFLQRAIDAATGARTIGRVLVVVRPEDAHLLDGNPAVELVANPHAAEGQSASIRLAAAHLATDSACEAVVFSVVDQPFMTPAVFDALATSWRAGEGEIVVSTFGGQRGNPVLFGRRFLTELQQLAGDVGGRVVLQAHQEDVHLVEVGDPEVGRDIDTWDEYERAIAAVEPNTVPPGPST